MSCSKGIELLFGYWKCTVPSRIPPLSNSYFKAFFSLHMMVQPLVFVKIIK